MGTRPSRAHPTASPPSAFRGRPAAPVWFAGSEVRREDAANGGRDLSATGRRHRQAPALPIPRLQRTEDSGRAATWDGVSGEPPETAGEPPALPIPRLQRTEDSGRAATWNESPASRRRQQASRPRSPFPDSRGRKTEGGQPPGTESPASRRRQQASRPRSPDCLFAPSLFSSDDAARAAAPPTQPAPGPPRPPCQARAPRQSPAPNSRAGFDRPRPRHPR